MRDLFRQPTCTCPTPADLVTAAFHDLNLEPCAHHQPDEIRRLETEASVADAEHRIEQTTDLLDRVGDTSNVVPFQPAGPTALNGVAASLAKAFGTQPSNDHHNFDGPDAA